MVPSSLSGSLHQLHSEWENAATPACLTHVQRSRMGSCAKRSKRSEMRWTNAQPLLCCGRGHHLLCPFRGKHKLKHPCIVGHTPGLSKEHAQRKRVVVPSQIPFAFWAFGMVVKKGRVAHHQIHVAPGPKPARPSRALKSELLNGLDAAFSAACRAASGSSSTASTTARLWRWASIKAKMPDPVPMSRMRVSPSRFSPPSTPTRGRPCPLSCRTGRRPRQTAGTTGVDVRCVP